MRPTGQACGPDTVDELLGMMIRGHLGIRKPSDLGSCAVACLREKQDLYEENFIPVCGHWCCPDRSRHGLERKLQDGAGQDIWYELHKNSEWK